MSELAPLIEDLALILFSAGVMTLLFKKLKQPLVLGYIVAGFLASPHLSYTPSVVDIENVHLWADIGVIFLLFALGLEFSFKKIVKVWGSAIIAACTIMMCSSCATIVAGGSPRITIDGDTREPVTIITEKQTYPDVTLPYEVQVNRHHIDGQRIQIKSEKDSYRDVVLEKKVNTWTWGNILIGGLVGWGVDLITNCVSKPSKPNYYIEKRKE